MTPMTTILLIGLGTFLIRFLPIYSGRFFENHPQWVRGFQTLPALIFAALVAPSFLHFQNFQGQPIDWGLLAAGVITVVVARMSGSVLIATFFGLLSYLTLISIFKGDL